MSKPKLIKRCRAEEEEVNEERNILRRTDRKKTNWIGHIIRRNCLLNHAIERNKERKKKKERERERRIELRGRRKIRHKRIMDDLKETRGYWK